MKKKTYINKHLYMGNSVTTTIKKENPHAV